MSDDEFDYDAYAAEAEASEAASAPVEQTSDEMLPSAKRSCPCPSSLRGFVCADCL